ncbi:sensor histidine kinase [Natrinema salaciae]|uniref:sensor histidine kinase n=1 Tax=Natrinema salaciae TaxID=1186196 RepID=UPI000B810454
MSSRRNGSTPGRSRSGTDRADGAERTNGLWAISVRDDGIGVDPDDANRIFGVFRRLHSREEDDGTGIGLALCRRIVERHGGRIWVDPAPGEGSTVTVAVPADGSQ